MAGINNLQIAQYTLGSAVTIDMHGLADGAKAISDAIDNSVTRYTQAHVQVMFKTNQHSIDKAKGSVVVGLLRSVDGGLTFDSHLRQGNILATIDDLDPNTAYTISVATNLLGILPSNFKISVGNRTGAPFFHKAEKFSVSWLGIKILELTQQSASLMLGSTEWMGGTSEWMGRI